MCKCLQKVVCVCSSVSGRQGRVKAAGVTIAARVALVTSCANQRPREDDDHVAVKVHSCPHAWFC